ncbi:MAG: hypothetical protein H6702_17725 [Myxococcales bacterium]|nr:hypothetical protein [Myxococcales bacterium]
MPSRLPTLPSIALLLAAATLTACGAAHRPSAPTMKPLALAQPAQPKVLEENHFQRDKVGTVSEGAIREILAAPVFLEAKARLGIVPVETGYELDKDVPLTEVTGQLAERLTDAGFFEVASEVTTDWPGTRSVAGLREIATRYRAEYLLLYRHRFVDWQNVNGWGVSWLAVLPILFAPHNTVEVSGVLEATLFDVKTGTLLFTVYERVGDERKQNIWHPARKLRHFKRDLLKQATEKLAAKVDGRLRLLVAARPEPSDQALAQAPVSAPAQAAPEPVAGPTALAEAR